MLILGNTFIQYWLDLSFMLEHIVHDTLEYELFYFSSTLHQNYRKEVSSALVKVYFKMLCGSHNMEDSFHPAYPTIRPD